MLRDVFLINSILLLSSRYFAHFSFMFDKHVIVEQLDCFSLLSNSCSSHCLCAKLLMDYLLKLYPVAMKAGPGLRK